MYICILYYIYIHIIHTVNLFLSCQKYYHQHYHTYYTRSVYFTMYPPIEFLTNYLSLF